MAIKYKDVAWSTKGDEEWRAAGSFMSPYRQRRLSHFGKGKLMVVTTPDPSFQWEAFVSEKLVAEGSDVVSLKRFMKNH